MGKGSKGGPNDGGGMHGKPYQKGNEAKQPKPQGDGRKEQFDPSKLRDPKK